MAKKKAARSKATPAVKVDDVDALLRTVDPARVAELEELRKLVLGADERVREGVKWNAVSFRLEDWFATLNLHRGAKSKGTPRPAIEDPDGRLEWRGDERALVDCGRELTEGSLEHLVRQWIESSES
jgi:hypothetical protein